MRTLLVFLFRGALQDKLLRKLHSVTGPLLGKAREAKLQRKFYSNTSNDSVGIGEFLSKFSSLTTLHWILVLSDIYIQHQLAEFQKEISYVHVTDMVQVGNSETTSYQLDSF